ncbi:MAG TPA: hypothetical protein VFM18_01945 [Methanosarcina sp.]|nr:hypothetical protein [Methanosarcina sp.]
MIKDLLNQIKGIPSKLVNIVTGLRAQGYLSISLVYPDKTVPLFEGKKNLVVHGGKLQMLRTLYQGGVGSPIATLRVGNGGTIDPNGRFPKTPTDALSALYSEVQTIPVTYTVDEAYPSVTYIADVGPDLCNDLLISEAGLFFQDGSMFNIKTFPGIPKTLDFSIHFEWVIKVN